MDDINIEDLISYVEERPVLWDKRMSEYKDKIVTRNAWQEIFEKYHSDFGTFDEKKKEEIGKEIMKKWVHVRDGFMRWRRKLKEKKKSGAGAVTIKNYVYHNQLMFLLPITEGNETETSGNTVEREDPLIEEEEENERLLDSRVGLSANTTPTIGSRKRKVDPVEKRLLDILEAPPSHDPPNRHLSFFKGVIPSLESFSDDEVINFQAGVLKLIMDIKRQRSQHGQSMIWYQQHPQYTSSTSMPHSPQTPVRGQFRNAVRARSMDSLHHDRLLSPQWPEENSSSEVTESSSYNYFQAS